MQLMYPSRDHVTSHDTFTGVRQSLESRGAATIVQFHPNADHGFLNPIHHDDAGNVTAARLAWPQTVTFMQSYLL